MSTFFFLKALANNKSRLNSLSYEIGTSDYFDNQIDTAFKYLTIANSFDKNNISVITNLGWVCLERKEIGLAVRHFESAYMLNPNNAETINNFGYGLYLQGRLKYAEEMILQAKDKAPKNDQSQKLGVLINFRVSKFEFNFTSQFDF